MENVQVFEVVLRVLSALACGSLVGIERLIAHKSAGMRTYALASGGSALFVALSQLYSVANNANPQYVLGQVIVGVGFIAAGAIITTSSSNRVVGLTTSSGLWFMSAIGASFGLGYYKIGFLMSALLIFTLAILIKFEDSITKQYLTNNVEPRPVKKKQEVSEDEEILEYVEPAKPKVKRRI
jgi:putative Mg2+ transporter-C (MgtC) family protein